MIKPGILWKLKIPPTQISVPVIICQIKGATQKYQRITQFIEWRFKPTLAEYPSKYYYFWPLFYAGVTDDSPIGQLIGIWN